MCPTAGSAQRALRIESMSWVGSDNGLRVRLRVSVLSVSVGKEGVSAGDVAGLSTPKADVNR